METSILAAIMALVYSNRIKFPMPPDVVLRINEFLNDPSKGHDDLVDAIKTNPVLAGRILQMANSIALRATSRIDSLEIAVARLGALFVRDLALSVSLKNQFLGSDKKAEAELAASWEESLKCGSRMIILQSILAEKGFKVSANTAMVVGLMYRIGDLPLIEYMHKHAEAAEPLENVDGHDRHMLSRNIVDNWGLPPEITDALTLNGGNIYSRMLQFVTEFMDGHSGCIWEPEFGLTFDDFLDEVAVQDEIVRMIEEGLR